MFGMQTPKKYRSSMRKKKVKPKYIKQLCHNCANPLEKDESICHKCGREKRMTVETIHQHQGG